MLSGPLPDSLGNYRNLTGLYASENGFGELVPEMLGSLVFLEFLHLGGNEFVGALPESVGN